MRFVSIERGGHDEVLRVHDGRRCRLLDADDVVLEEAVLERVPAAVPALAVAEF